MFNHIFIKCKILKRSLSNINLGIEYFLKDQFDGCLEGILDNYHCSEVNQERLKLE